MAKKNYEGFVNALNSKQGGGASIDKHGVRHFAGFALTKTEVKQFPKQEETSLIFVLIKDTDNSCIIDGLADGSVNLDTATEEEIFQFIDDNISLEVDEEELQHDRDWIWDQIGDYLT